MSAIWCIGLITTPVIGVLYNSSQFSILVLHPAASAPGGVQAQRSADGRYMIVSWTPLTLVQARGFVQYYIISVSGEVMDSRKRQAGGSYDISKDTLLVPAASTSATVSGLYLHTEYVVSVAAANGLQSPPSEPPAGLDENLVTVGTSSEEQTVAGWT